MSDTCAPIRHRSRERGRRIAYYQRDFWSTENLKFRQPHYRMEKAVRIITDFARGRECDLLDIGCGPATLMHMLPSNIHYYGIDIAIQEPAPNLSETDIVKAPIRFADKTFDIVMLRVFLNTFPRCSRRSLPRSRISSSPAASLS